MVRKSLAERDKLKRQLADTIAGMAPTPIASAFSIPFISSHHPPKCRPLPLFLTLCSDFSPTHTRARVRPAHKKEKQVLWNKLRKTKLHAQQMAEAAAAAAAAGGGSGVSGELRGASSGNNLYVAWVVPCDSDALLARLTVSSPPPSPKRSTFQRREHREHRRGWRC